jgi:hypothetical protein
MTILLSPSSEKPASDCGYNAPIVAPTPIPRAALEETLSLLPLWYLYGRLRAMIWISMSFTDIVGEEPAAAVAGKFLPKDADP